MSYFCKQDKQGVRQVVDFSFYSLEKVYVRLIFIQKHLVKLSCKIICFEVFFVENFFVWLIGFFVFIKGLISLMVRREVGCPTFVEFVKCVFVGLMGKKLTRRLIK